MNVRSAASLLLLLPALAACRAASFAQQPAVAAVTPLFGPVISHDVIRGREDDGEVVMVLVGPATIVSIEPGESRASRLAIAVAPGEACWGLARLEDGSLWTLKGRSAVVRVEPDGRVSKAFPLAEPHVGLFGSGSRLIYQKAMATAPAAALSAGVPGSEAVAAWGNMVTRVFPGIARAQSSALNMVACGSRARGGRPCWFPNEAAVYLFGPAGETRKIALPGLTVVSPETLLAAENPMRPVRDAYVDRQGRIWILSSGEAPAGAPDVPGGWILARYAADGTPEGQVRLAEAVRLILRADDRRVLVLSGSGYVGEVRPW